MMEHAHTQALDSLVPEDRAIKKLQWINTSSVNTWVLKCEEKTFISLKEFSY